MDNQPLSRTAQPEDKQNQLAKLIRQAEVSINRSSPKSCVRYWSCIKAEQTKSRYHLPPELDTVLKKEAWPR